MKRDTSNMMRPASPGFTVNDWLETLLRLKADDPARYEREVPAHVQVTVGRYAELKARHERRAA